MPVFSVMMVVFVMVLSADVIVVFVLILSSVKMVVSVMVLSAVVCPLYYGPGHFSVIFSYFQKNFCWCLCSNKTFV